ncbi:MAG: acetyl-CoA carboxylase biotin carboxyl carrier protein [Geminicoccaceae bacterium]
MSDLKVDEELIEKLAELLERTGLTEIEIGQGEQKLRVAKGAVVTTGPAPAPTAAAVDLAPTPTESASNRDGTVNAPMVGTAYLASEPGAEPFVTVGSQVQEGQTLLIIEAMKVLNPIRAPRAGTVVEVLVGNAAPVEYGEPLMVLS